jgi:protein disulfide-isomerase A1
VDSVVIAKMDGTENEHADVEVKGFPTILFFPAGADKKAVSFSGGDRSLKALTKFIKKNAKVKFELPKVGFGCFDKLA